MDPNRHRTSTPHSLLKPSEFACLQQDQTCLYTEIVQVVEVRDRYWARPVLLCEWPEEDGTERSPTVYDVRSCSDLLWPRSLFRCVLDTELIPLLSHLQPEPLSMSDLTPDWADHLMLARKKLHQFTQALWQACPMDFQERS